MCTVCGCGEGETQIEGQGQPQAPHHNHTHDHEHEHGDGTLHSHPHVHVHSHAEAENQGDHPPVHSHSHAEAEGQDDHHHHDQLHAAGVPHDHPHDLEPPAALHFGLGPAKTHAPGLSQERLVRLEQDILGKNNAYALANRRWLVEHGIFAVNLVSSPGSGKTTVLVETIRRLATQARVAVIEGDQQTSQDADRIRSTGAAAIQVNTGKGCHLDAHMVGHALEHLALPDDSLLMIENVGNLVCPAAFDLGEANKVVILSVTEGEDKPLKYPDMFHAADLMLLNKVDLLPYLSFDVARCIDYARRINPRLEVLQLSATTGQGLDAWLAWLDAGLAQAKATRQANVELLKRRIAELEAQLAAKG